MANREENIPSDPSNEGGSDDQPRDLQELLLWHQELSSRPSRESNNPRKRRMLWKLFQIETDVLKNSLKWNELIRGFATRIIERGFLDSGDWDEDPRSRLHLPCSAEDQFITSGMTLKNLALCRVHKSLKYTTRLRGDVWFENYRIQPPILDHLPIPRTLIEELKTLWRTCEKHHNMCGTAHILLSHRFRILKCSHQSEEIRAGDAKCDKTECALYIFLFNKRHWDDKFNDRTHDWCDLAEALGEKSGFGPLTAVRLMADAARHGMQSFIFME